MSLKMFGMYLKSKKTLAQSHQWKIMKNLCNHKNHAFVFTVLLVNILNSLNAFLVISGFEHNAIYVNTAFQVHVKCPVLENNHEHFL